MLRCNTQTLTVTTMKTEIYLLLHSSQHTQVAIVTQWVQANDLVITMTYLKVDSATPWGHTCVFSNSIHFLHLLSLTSTSISYMLYFISNAYVQCLSAMCSASTVCCCCKHRHRTADIRIRGFGMDGLFVDLLQSFSKTVKYRASMKQPRLTLTEESLQVLTEVNTIKSQLIGYTG